MAKKNIDAQHQVGAEDFEAIKSNVYLVFKNAKYFCLTAELLDKLNRLPVSAIRSHAASFISSLLNQQSGH